MPTSPYKPKRIAVFSVHTSPLDAPGAGDAGGMNVYVRETAKGLAARGVEVDIYTRATSADAAPVVEAFPGVRVLHVQAGPFTGLKKEDLPAQLLTLSVAAQDLAKQLDAKYDLIHSHYWLSGQVGWACAKRWHVPLVHTMHTMAKVKNLALARGDKPEPAARILGEEQVVHGATRLVANTHREAAELIEHYDALPERVAVVHPGVDLNIFRPADGQAAARARLGWDLNEQVIVFVGRLQPLKAPDVLVKAMAQLVVRGDSPRLVICGGPSGSGREMREHLEQLAQELGIQSRVEFVPPQTAESLADYYRAADLVAVPSYSESFGLVAIEAQACGTPVIAAAVGGLVTAVKDNFSGLLVAGHQPRMWTDAIHLVLSHPERLVALRQGALLHAHRFSWDTATDALLRIYKEVLTEVAAHSAL